LKAIRMVKRHDKASRAPGFYQPLPDIQALELLEARMARSQLVVKRVFHLFAVIAALLVLINLLNTATDSTLSPMLRAWALIPVLGLGSILALLFAHAYWTRRRALEAQRVLVSNRRRYNHESQARSAEERIGERLEGLPSRNPELERALESAKQASTRALGSLEGASSEECEQQCALLDAYRVSLDNLEIESLLCPGYFTLPEALESMTVIASILVSGTEAATSPTRPALRPPDSL